MSQRAAPYQLAAIALVACSMLAYEVLLTRICGLRLYHHFGFLVISNCLLGIGASGTLLTLYQDEWKLEPRRYLGRFAVLYLASLPLSYWLMLKYPLPEQLDLSRASMLSSVTLYSLAGAVPFFFGGAVIGMLLTFNPDSVNHLYGADLVGAGLGCLACPALLPLVGAGGVFVFTALLALVGALVISSHGPRRRRVLLAGTTGALLLLLIMPRLDRWFPVPSKGWVDFLRATSRTDEGAAYSVWTANSRIDMFSGSDTAPGGGTCGRGKNQDGLPPHPPAKAIFQDATAGTVAVDYTSHLGALAILNRSTYAAASMLRPGARVFIIGLGGGNDVWATLSQEAASVKAVELNWPIVRIHRTVAHDYTAGFVDDPRVELVVGEGRSALMREASQYDVIQMTGVDTWTALASGAYVLAENYLYTKEAIALMARRLAPNGIIQITRFARDMEALRLLSNVYAALYDAGVSNIEQCIIAIRTPDESLAMLIKKEPFRATERRRLARWARNAGIDIAYMPLETRAGPLVDFLSAADKRAFIDRFPQNISPTTDDRPYFFNFARWDRFFSTKTLANELPSISQGNPLFIVAQLGFSALLSTLLILLPLARRRNLPRRGAAGALAYFASLGLGFILIEIALMQKLTLFLGQPVYSLTVTLFSLLVFTGLGSLVFSGRLPAENPRRAWVVPAALGALTLLFSFTATPLLDRLITLPLGGRVLVAALLLAPFGLVLGIPFAYGVRVIARQNPALLPWAWAINGCFSVVGSILTVVLSMTFGFRTVLFCAAAIYAAGLLALQRGFRASTAP
jgi:spermidine synthase